MTPKERYGRLLRRAVRLRGVLASDVARAVGAHSSSMSDWMNGKKMPQLDYQLALAETLMYDPLRTFAISLRTKRCELCGHEFVDQTKHVIARYCSKRHAKRASAQMAKGRRQEAHKSDRAELAIMREAVRLYCVGCEPSGVCRTAECPLRPVSPLPLLHIERQADLVEHRPTEKMLAYLSKRYDAA